MIKEEMYAAVRKRGHRHSASEFIDVSTLDVYLHISISKTKRKDIEMGTEWAYMNPVVRFIAVNVEEIKLSKVADIY